MKHGNFGKELVFFADLCYNEVTSYGGGSSKGRAFFMPLRTVGDADPYKEKSISL